MYTPSPRTKTQNPEAHDSVMRHDGKCLCQICDCGQKHKCPEPGYRLQTETTSRFYYKPHEISPQKYNKKTYQPNTSRYEPNDLISNYKGTYVPHKFNREEMRTQTTRAQYSPSKFKLQSETQYKTRYSPQRLKKQQAIYSPSKKREYVPNPDKFEGTTTYKDEYSPKKNEGSFSPIKKYEYSPNKFPLQTQTTYNNFYKPHKIQSNPIRSQAKDNLGLSPERSKFQGQSRYREFYPVRELHPVKRCAAEGLLSRPYRCSPEKTHAHYNASANRWY